MINLNKEICEFIGAFIGDGYLGKYQRSYVVCICGHKELDKKYIHYLSRLIKKNFDWTKPKIYERKDEKTIMLRIYSKELFNFMMSLGFNCGVKARNVEIPKIILKEEELTKATIRGIFDTDGCVYFDKRKKYNKKYPRITLQTASRNLLKQLETCLSKRYNLYIKYANANGYRNYIEIYGHTQLERFLKEIGFSNERHIKKCPRSIVAIALGKKMVSSYPQNLGTIQTKR